MSDQLTCPKCGAEEGDCNQFRYQRFMACGTSLNAVQGGWEVCQQSDRCRIRAMKSAGLNAINTLRNARGRTDSYEDDLEYERAIDLLIKAGCGPTTEGGTDDTAEK